MNDLQTYLRLNQVLEAFLGRVGMLVCARCFRWVRGEGAPIYHTWGEFNAKVKATEALTGDHFDRFVADIDQGLFRGLWLAFLVFFLRWLEENPGKTPQKADNVGPWHRGRFRTNPKGHEVNVETLVSSPDIRLFLSCLFQGLIPAARLPPEGVLEDYCPQLLSAPGPLFERAKRLDEEGRKGSLPTGSHPLLRFFFANVEPALARFHQGRDQIWLRHGVEDQSAARWELGADYPPAKSQVNKEIDFFAVEVDRPPFTNPRSALPEAWQDAGGNTGFGEWACSDHNRVGVWNRLKGFIPAKEFARLGGTVRTPVKWFGRDHPHIVKTVPLENWTLVHKVATPVLEKANKSQLEILVGLKTPLVSEAVMCLFFKVTRMLEDRLRFYNGWW